MVKLSTTYLWICGDIFLTGLDLIIWRCIQEDEVFDIFNACHNKHVDAILLIKEPHTWSFIWGIIGILFSEMPRNTSKATTIVNRWAS
jgi:hypothetical protein